MWRFKRSSSSSQHSHPHPHPHPHQRQRQRQQLRQVNVQAVQQQQMLLQQVRSMVEVLHLYARAVAAEDPREIKRLNVIVGQMHNLLEVACDASRGDRKAIKLAATEVGRFEDAVRRMADADDGMQDAALQLEPHVANMKRVVQGREVEFVQVPGASTVRATPETVHESLSAFLGAKHTVDDATEHVGRYPTTYAQQHDRDLAHGPGERVLQDVVPPVRAQDLRFQPGRAPHRAPDLSGAEPAAAAGPVARPDRRGRRPRRRAGGSNHRSRSYDSHERNGGDEGYYSHERNGGDEGYYSDERHERRERRERHERRERRERRDRARDHGGRRSRDRGRRAGGSSGRSATDVDY